MSIFDRTEHDEKTAELIEDIGIYYSLCFALELYKITALILNSVHNSEREDENCVGD